MSDFFLPGLGGVEIHMYNLAQCLIARGHHVVVVTKLTNAAHFRRTGVRWLSNCLKVYYIPFYTFDFPNGSTTLPSFSFYHMIMRSIMIRERIDIAHCHQSVSSLCMEGLFAAVFAGTRCVFTEHSLYGFHDIKEILLNKSSGAGIALSDHSICVSHAQRENFVLRFRVCPTRVSVIPNAVDTRRFTPRPEMVYKTFASETVVTVVVLTRLTYRKGVDMLCAVVPELCALRSDVRVVIGGDGPRRGQVLEMIHTHKLQDRVKWVGSVNHADVPSFLRSGQVFMNFSLTESFCIAILEAVSCGLLAVATAVGGVPEVLPPDMLLLADPTPSSYLQAALRAISLARKVSPWDFHRRVSMYYSWSDVAARTERVYYRVMAAPKLTKTEIFLHAYGRGPLVGKYLLIMWMLMLIVRAIVDFLWPRESFDVAPSASCREYLRRRAELDATASEF